MKRQIIKIDEELCNGCGICVTACHEGAIGLVNGKAKLLRDDYCDGMGDCLPQCPTGAITFEEREALPYDEAAVIASQMAKAKAETHAQMPQGMGCPSSQARSFHRGTSHTAANPSMGTSHAAGFATEAIRKIGRTESSLAQWPVQIKLVAPEAPYFQGARLLIAADCCAFAYASFHRDFMAGRVTLIGCPKLDGVDYAEKLTAIIAGNDIQEVVVARMSVPCCGGIEVATRRAVEASGKNVLFDVVTIDTNGDLL